MKWPDIKTLAETVPLPDGYKYALPTQSDIPALIHAVDEWFPGLAVGNASCYLREDFYKSKVFFEDAHERDFFLMLFQRGEDWDGMLSLERDKDSQVLYGRVGTIAEAHRGAGPGEVKRVFEAIHVKVLVTDRDFLRPKFDGMTPATGALYKHLFSGQLDGAAEA